MFDIKGENIFNKVANRIKIDVLNIIFFIKTLIKRQI